MLMYSYQILCISICVFCQHVISSQSDKPCAGFKLSSVPLIFEEDPEITLTFDITNECGSDVQFVTVSVIEDHPPHAIICQMFHTNEGCHSSPGCSCGNKSHSYSATKRAAGFEQVVWKLACKLNDGSQFHKLVQIRSKVFPRIENLSILVDEKPVSSPVLPNSNVTIICAWDGGYPPMTSRPFLFNRRGQRLETSPLITQVNKIQSVMTSVQCDDAGVIMCEAQPGGSAMNKTLLVECAPSFMAGKVKTFSVVSGDNLDIRLPVRTHNERIDKCVMEKQMFNGALFLNPCESLTGSPPDLTLNVNVTHVTPPLQGLWKLSLTNDVGVSHVNLYVDVTTEQFEETVVSHLMTTVPDERSQGDMKMTLTSFGGIIVGVAGCIVVVVVAVINVIVWTLFRRRGAVLPPPIPHNFRRAHGVDAVFQVPAAVQEIDEPDDPRVSCHIYAVIPDEETDSTSGDDFDSSEPESSESSGYLHPTSSVADVTTTAQTRTEEATGTIIAAALTAGVTFPTQTANDAEADQAKTSSPADVEAHTDDVMNTGASADPPYENIVGVPIDQSCSI